MTFPTHPVECNAPEDDFGLIGNSTEIQAVRRQIRKLRHDSSPVLVVGESGVGKELVARALHSESVLSEKVFLPVDAASLAGDLMESELFGHLKGAFTGAIENKVGLVQAADGGTLFLDEIGELPIGMQAKLLRMLQEQEVRPIGAIEPTSVKVRVLAATNRDLAKEVEVQRFRKDLFYRLNVITITVPPLRERRSDVPALVRHFVARDAVHAVTISDGAMRAFTNYHWPGNVRELQSVVRRLVVMKSDPVIQPDDLPDDLRDAPERTTPGVDRRGQVLPLAELERRHILHTIELTRGDRNAAAHMLGIGRSTLYRKLKSYEGGSNGIPVQTSLFPI